ncbi:MAG: hypothetical protein Q9166_004971 [cf. Caloplaca sp. 2 TL-2023]
MSRTVADATRFTATSPHAYSKPSSILRSAATTFSPSSFPSQSQARKPPSSAYPPKNAPQQPPPPQQPETPQQKVARIRAFREAQKLNQYTWWDRTVIRGRVWADRAHRITVVFIMGFTGNISPIPFFSPPPSSPPNPIPTHQLIPFPPAVIAGVVTVFTLADMILYNRKQRALYYATQASLYENTLSSAIASLQSGTPLTEEETNVLNRERMVLKAEAEQEERKKRGWGVQKMLFGGMDMGAEAEDEEAGTGREDSRVVEGGERLLGNAEMEGRESLVGMVKKDGVNGSIGDVAETVGGQGRVMAAVEEKRREGEKPTEDVKKFGGPTAGGSLDRMAEGVAEKARSGWRGWFGGR